MCGLESWQVLKLPCALCRLLRLHRPKHRTHVGGRTCTSDVCYVPSDVCAYEVMCVSAGSVDASGALSQEQEQARQRWRVHAAPVFPDQALITLLAGNGPQAPVQRPTQTVKTRSQITSPTLSGIPDK